MSPSRTGSTSRVPQVFLTTFSWDVVSELYSQVILGHIATAYHQDIWGFDKYGYNLCFTTEYASYLNPSLKPFTGLVLTTGGQK